MPSGDLVAVIASALLGSAGVGGIVSTVLDKRRQAALLPEQKENLQSQTSSEIADTVRDLLEQAREQARFARAAAEQAELVRVAAETRARLAERRLRETRHKMYQIIDVLRHTTTDNLDRNALAEQLQRILEQSDIE